MITFKEALEECIRSFKRTHRYIEKYMQEDINEIYTHIRKTYTLHGACGWIEEIYPQHTKEFKNLYGKHNKFPYIVRICVEGFYIPTLSSLAYIHRNFIPIHKTEVLELSALRIEKLKELLLKL